MRTAAASEHTHWLEGGTALTLELQKPRRRELDHADVAAKERLLEQLRWQLAAVAGRAASEELRQRRMTTAAASIAARVTGLPSRWLSGRNPLHAEAAAVLALYGLYEFAVHVLGALYPPFVLLVIVATGNHFFLDAAAGAITVALAAASARLITRIPRHGQLARLFEQSLPAPRPERLAA
jgi:hypothetical protein